MDNFNHPLEKLFRKGRLTHNHVNINSINTLAVFSVYSDNHFTTVSVLWWLYFGGCGRDLENSLETKLLGVALSWLRLIHLICVVTPLNRAVSLQESSCPSPAFLLRPVFPCGWQFWVGSKTPPKLVLSNMWPHLPTESRYVSFFF